jgi:hypothetical protein
MPHEFLRAYTEGTGNGINRFPPRHYMNCIFPERKNSGEQKKGDNAATVIHIFSLSVFCPFFINARKYIPRFEEKHNVFIL